MKTEPVDGSKEEVKKAFMALKDQNPGKDLTLVAGYPYKPGPDGWTTIGMDFDS